MGGGGEGGPEAVAFEFPVSETSSYAWPPRIPGRLRRRLLVQCNKTPSTVEEIEAKLRQADLRRQQYHEQLSSKARTKPRSPSRSSSSHEEDLGQRLEAKLQAAEKKRLSILANAQMRLARLDEMRQAAKTGVELRYKKKQENLGSIVETRFQQAEANRMLMLKAYRQRRATVKDRSSQSLLRKVARENKYKERVRAAIHQKRAAAEKKRLGFIEQEKKRACARILQVRRVARSVSYQREIERRRMRDQLEDRMQRAKRQRAEYLRQRAKVHGPVQVNWNRMHRQADHLARKLARCWKRFLEHRRSTLALAMAHDALKINEECVKLMPFDELARRIESTDILQTVKALLDRFECRLKVSRAVAPTNHPSNMENIDHLLQRVASPKRRTTPRMSLRSRDGKKTTPSRETVKFPSRLSRYPVRVFLCAYMILSHPDAVFSGRGEQEIALAKAAELFVREFEFLLKLVLEGPVHSSVDSTLPKHCTFRSQLAVFDKAWCYYLNCFVVWKVKDAKLLEEDLVRAACQLELSMIQTCKMTAEGESGDLSHDMKAVQKQVTDDQKLLREKVKHLSGDAGIERMECALTETRSRYFQAKENGSPLGSPVVQFLSPSGASSFLTSTPIANSDKKRDLVESVERLSRVVCSLFSEDDSPSKGFGSSAPTASMEGDLGSSVRKSVTENELIVNEFLHTPHKPFIDIFSVTDDDQNNVKGMISGTMESAFWDSIIESTKQHEPSYDQVLQVMREMKDELCQVAPESWRQEIIEVIDLDIISQVFKSGNLDIHYLGKILEFALVTLQRLSSPASDDEMKSTHQSLMKELTDICQDKDESNHSSIIAIIKGLRFVLGQIKVLKREISKARIIMMEPLLKGPAGLDYLRNAFANRHGPPSDACTSIPLTVHWFSSVWNPRDQEWEEHSTSLLALNQDISYDGYVPSTTLRSGGNFLVKPKVTPPTSKGNQQPECKGEIVDLVVRLGLLKLTSAVTGLTQEVLPETFMLNLARLRGVQAQIQKIIATSVSILICRQTLLSEKIVTSPGDMENIISNCTERLVELLDRIEDAGTGEIVGAISRLSVEGNEVVDNEKLQSRKIVMARMLAKSLQPGDAVFERVNRAVYMAARGVVLGGSGSSGKKLAVQELRQIGAASLAERLVEAAEVLVVAATVSVGVHGPWYMRLTENM